MGMRGVYCLCAALAVAQRLTCLFLSSPIAPQLAPRIAKCKPKQARAESLVALKAGFGSVPQSEAVLAGDQAARLLGIVFQDVVAQKLVDDSLAERYAELEKRVRIDTLPLSGDANLSTATLVGVNHASLLRADAVGQIVAEEKPTALVLEMCRERLGLLLVDEGHQSSKAQGFFDDQPEAIRSFLSTALDRGIEARSYAQSGAMREMRDQRIATSVYAAACLGHKAIVACMGAAHLAGVEAALHRLSGTSELSLDDTAFLNERGLDMLSAATDKIKRDIPAKRHSRIQEKLRNHEDLNGKERSLRQRFKKLKSPERVFNKLKLNSAVCEPVNFKRLSSWYAGLPTVRAMKRKTKARTRLPKGRGQFKG